MGHPLNVTYNPPSAAWGGLLWAFLKFYGLGFGLRVRGHLALVLCMQSGMNPGLHFCMCSEFTHQLGENRHLNRTGPELGQVSAPAEVFWHSVPSVLPSGQWTVLHRSSGAPLGSNTFSCYFKWYSKTRPVSATGQEQDVLHVSLTSALR